MGLLTLTPPPAPQHQPRVVVIYHANCADGFAAAWCFWRQMKDRAEYIPGRYGEEPPDLTGADVYLVDFSYKRATMERVVAQAHLVWLIDHHVSAIEDLDGLAGLRTFTNVGKSGATLAWDFLNPFEPRPPLLGHIEDRDLWRFQLPHTREIQADLFSRPYSFEVWDELMNGDATALMRMTANGAAIERKHHKDVAELVAVCRRRMTIAGFDVPAASLPYTLSSDAGHLMAQGEHFAACYWDTDTHRHFSLRSTDEGMNVAGIAQQYGGGGHMHAAGFRVPRDHQLAKA